MQADGALGMDIDSEGGVVLRALGLWLDPPGARPAAFVSHAHALGGLESGRAFASPETLSVARALGATATAPGAHPIEWDGAAELPLLPPWGGGTARLSIARAGHMLGAAQLVVNHPRGRFVYAGDWSSAADATHPPGVAVECDELAVTTTFALPIFRFEPPASVLDTLLAWCRQELASSATPVVLAQTPGLAQTCLLALAAHGVPAAAFGEVLPACRAYESAGVSFAEVKEYVPGLASAVVVAPARTKRSDLRTKGHTSVAYASGWALLGARVEQRRADAAFVVADHADSDALLSLVRASGARLVHAAYGDARAFAQLLLAGGFEGVKAYEAPCIDDRSGS